MHLKTITPNWLAPKNITAFTTTIFGGKSLAPYQSFNLGGHVGDNPDHVTQNRLILSNTLGNDHITYLNQTHGDNIVYLDNSIQNTPNADACVTDQKNVACIIMTADCLPVLVCNKKGDKVAALHCGWKGLAQNLIQKTIKQYFINKKNTAENCLVWFGPAIAQNSYEIDEPIFKTFTELNNNYIKAFKPTRPNHYEFSLITIAQQQCLDLGIPKQQINHCELDTFTDERFYSYRRNTQTGRIASLIMING